MISKKAKRIAKKSEKLAKLKKLSDAENHQKSEIPLVDQQADVSATVLLKFDHSKSIVCEQPALILPAI